MTSRGNFADERSCESSRRTAFDVESWLDANVFRRQLLLTGFAVVLVLAIAYPVGFFGWSPSLRERLGTGRWLKG